MKVWHASAGLLPDAPLAQRTSHYLEAMTAPQPAGDGGVTAYAAAEKPVALSVALVEDERTPEDMLCMGTYRGDHLIARCVVSPDMWEQVTEHELFGEPVPIVLVAREASPGVQCQLFALLQLPDEMVSEEDDEDEAEAPWASSVPGSGYEAAVNDEESDDTDQLVAFPLGQIVRFEKDRVHRDDLAAEAADILTRLIEGKTTEVVDKALEDLLDQNLP
jgi:hypothetical protein